MCFYPRNALIREFLPYPIWLVDKFMVSSLTASVNNVMVDRKACLRTSYNDIFLSVASILSMKASDAFAEVTLQ
jgi:hypothetical protein